jgi:hypothetical protein
MISRIQEYADLVDLPLDDFRYHTTSRLWGLFSHIRYHQAPDNIPTNVRPKKATTTQRAKRIRKAMLFPVIEFGVLCRHCPYYAKSGKTINCLAGSGMFKTYKYDPRPMRRWEYFVMYCYYTFMIGFPIFGIRYGIYFIANNCSQYGKIALLGMIGLIAAFIFSIIAFNYCLAVYVCRKCVNFSCPWNKVEKPVVYEYLRQNPVMREAWEKEGYQLG